MKLLNKNLSLKLDIIVTLLNGIAVIGGVFVLNGLIALQEGAIRKSTTFICKDGYDYENERQVILVKDSETGEIIRQIPPREMLNLLKQLEEISGIIYHSHV